jgi:hypothetical protein
MALRWAPSDCEKLEKSRIFCCFKIVASADGLVKANEILDFMEKRPAPGRARL